MMADFSMPLLFAGILTPFTLKKHTIPGAMTKPRKDKANPQEYKSVLCNFFPHYSGNKDGSYTHTCHLHLHMAVRCCQCNHYVNFSRAELCNHFKMCDATGLDSGLASDLD